MATIKLLNVGTVDEAIRLQSQLRVGTHTADFILENGILKNWSNGNNGFDFYPCDLPYEIVSEKSEMKKQIL